MKTYNERHLYIEHVASGWLISRPSGAAVARQIASKEDAEAMLRDAGYNPAFGSTNGQWDRRDIL